MMFVPGVGFVVLGGWIVAALGGAVVGGGLAVLGGALASIGIPENSVLRYESDLKAGSFLLLAHGNQSECQEVKDILSKTTATSVEAFAAKTPEEVGKG
jgi:hypothetical protein